MIEAFQNDFIKKYEAKRFVNFLTDVFWDMKLLFLLSKIHIYYLYHVKIQPHIAKR